VGIFPPPEAARRLWLEFREPSALWAGAEW
jgi:hypothetical protein